MNIFNIYTSQKQWFAYNGCNRFPLLCPNDRFLPFQLGETLPPSILLVDISAGTSVAFPITMLKNTNFYYDGSVLPNPLIPGHLYCIQIGDMKSDVVRIMYPEELRTSITAAHADNTVSLANWGIDFTGFAFKFYLREELERAESIMDYKILVSNYKNFYTLENLVERKQVSFTPSEALRIALDSVKMYDQVHISNLYSGEEYDVIDRIEMKNDRKDTIATLTAKISQSLATNAKRYKPTFTITDITAVKTVTAGLDPVDIHLSVTVSRTDIYGGNIKKEFTVTIGTQVQKFTLNFNGQQSHDINVSYPVVYPQIGPLVAHVTSDVASLDVTFNLKGISLHSSPGIAATNDTYISGFAPGELAGKTVTTGGVQIFAIQGDRIVCIKPGTAWNIEVLDGSTLYAHIPLSENNPYTTTVLEVVGKRTLQLVNASWVFQSPFHWNQMHGCTKVSDGAVAVYAPHTSSDSIAYDPSPKTNTDQTGWTHP